MVIPNSNSMLDCMFILYIFIIVFHKISMNSEKGNTQISVSLPLITEVKLIAVNSTKLSII